MCHLSSGIHRKSNIGFPEGWCVIGTITCYGDDVAQLFESRHNNILVIRARSCQHLELVSDSLHVFNVANTLLIFPVLETHNFDLFLSIFIDKPANVVVELWALHAHAFFVALRLAKDAALTCNGDGRNLVVTGDHSDPNTGIVALSDGFWHFISDDIFNTCDCNQNIISFFNLGEFGILLAHVLVGWATITLFQILVSEANGSQCIACKILDRVVNLFLNLIIDLLFSTIPIQVVLAAFKNNF